MRSLSFFVFFEVASVDIVSFIAEHIFFGEMNVKKITVISFALFLKLRESAASSQRGSFQAETRSVSANICKQSASQNERKFDVIFTGQISEFFAQTSALIKVLKIYRGDPRHDGNFVIVKGFRNCGGKQWKPYKLGEIRLFFAAKIHDGVFELENPGVPLSYSDSAQKRNKINYHHGGSRRHRNLESGNLKITRYALAFAKALVRSEKSAALALLLKFFKTLRFRSHSKFFERRSILAHLEILNQCQYTLKDNDFRQNTGFLRQNFRNLSKLIFLRESRVYILAF